VRVTTTARTESEPTPGAPKQADRRHRNAGSGELIGVVLGFDLVLAVVGMTQWLAYRMAYHPALGKPAYVLPVSWRPFVRAAAVLAIGCGVVAMLTARSATIDRNRARMVMLSAAVIAGGALITTFGPVYLPQRGIVWLLALRRSPDGAAIIQQAIRAFGACFICLLTTTLVFRPRRIASRPSDSHGTARWGTGATLRSAVGLELGRVSGEVIGRYNGDGHVLTIAPTRTGKGVSVVIPNLLHYPGSVIVTDPKGENYAVTARRRRELGTDVYALDPFVVVNGAASFNPLDIIDVSGPDANDDAWMIADMLVVPNESIAEETFWNEEARALLAGMVMFVAAKGQSELRTLTHLRSLLTLPPDQFQFMLTEMRDSDAVGGLVARAAARLLQKAERERSGVMSTAQRHTHFLDSPRMARVLSSSSFALADIKQARVSVYLILPPERMDTHRAWMRVMTACCMLAMTRTRGVPRERVLFLLDEFANLGRMRPVERAISLAAAYGASFWLLVQDLAQLKGTYSEQWQTFIANADVLQVFGINDWDTAEYISKMTGESTIEVESENESRGVSRGKNTSRQQSAARSVAEKGRRLLLADEVRRMSTDSQLLFIRGGDPLRPRRLNYLRDGEYAGQADPNPLHLPRHAE
jgi:type IV secretion system protein VirD4